MLSINEQNKIINAILRVLNKENAIIFSTCRDSAIEAYKEACERLTIAGIIYDTKYFSDCITIKINKHRLSFLYLDDTTRKQKCFVFDEAKI